MSSPELSSTTIKSTLRAAQSRNSSSECRSRFESTKNARGANLDRINVIRTGSFSAMAALLAGGSAYGNAMRPAIGSAKCPFWAMNWLADDAASAAARLAQRTPRRTTGAAEKGQKDTERSRSPAAAQPTIVDSLAAPYAGRKPKEARRGYGVCARRINLERAQTARYDKLAAN
jgi:hypothetical protein